MRRTSHDSHEDGDRQSGAAAASDRVEGWARDYSQDLQRFLAKRRIIESDIKDICQEVFLRLLRFDRSEVVQNPVAYLFRVATNVAHDFNLRRPDWASMDSPEASHAAREVAIEEPAETLLRRRALWEAMEKLPPLPRAALALQTRDDLSHEQIAKRLGVSRRALRKIITRGHELLRAELTREL